MASRIAGAFGLRRRGSRPRRWAAALLLAALPLLAWPMTGARAVPGPSRMARFETLETLATPDPRVRSVPHPLAAGMFRAPEATLPELVGFLVGGTDDGFLKVRRIHDWIAVNIDYDASAYFSGNYGRGGFLEPLRRRQAVCDGYAELFREMCRLAGIPCRKVYGYVRGYGYSLFAIENPTAPNHAWNAVEINHHWYLLDVTWDAGTLDGQRYRRDYTTEYLFLNPDLFVNTHYPVDPADQLLMTPLSPDEFRNRPYLHRQFASYGLAFPDLPARTETVAEAATLTIQLPREVRLMARLYAASGQEYDRRTMICREATTAKILVRFPAPGDYRLEVFAWDGRSGSEAYLPVVSLGYRCQTGTAIGFAKSYPAPVDGICLFSPVESPLRRQRYYEFRIRVPGASQVVLIAQDEFIELERDPRDGALYTVTRSFPVSGEVLLAIQLPTGIYQTLYEYRVGE